MNARRLVLGAVLVAAVAALAAAVATTRPARGDDPEPRAGRQVDVVMIQCVKRSAEFVVSAYEGSAAAPAQRSGRCAETMALLLRDGFALDDTGYSREADAADFVLTRR